MSYRIEWIGPIAGLGVVSLLMVPFVGAALAVVVVLTLAVAIPLALVGAIVAVPFLLVRAVHRHPRSGRARPTYIANPKVREQTTVPAGTVSHPALSGLR